MVGLAAQSVSMDRSHALPYHKVRRDFLRPGGQLPGRYLGVEIISPYDNGISGAEDIFQDGGNPAVTATAHAMDVKDGLHFGHLDSSLRSE